MEKEFKHKVTGEIGYYKDGLFKQDKCVMHIGCEPSNEFWTDITKYFEILKERASSNIGSNNIEIVSVKRLPDGEVFTVGDKAKTQHTRSYPHIISSIEIKQKCLNRIVGGWNYDGVDRIWLNWEENSGGNWLESSDKVKIPIYKTCDGFEAFGGDILYCVTEDTDSLFQFTATRAYIIMGKIFAKQENAEAYIKDFKNYKTVDGDYIKEGQTFYIYDDVRYKCFEATYGQFKNKSWDGKRYKTKEEVLELIIMNKPCLSLNDLLDSWSEVGDREVYASSPMFNKFKNTVKEKLKL